MAIPAGVVSDRLVRRQVEGVATGAGVLLFMAMLSAEGSAGWRVALGTCSFLILVVLYVGLQVLETCRADREALARNIVQATPETGVPQIHAMQPVEADHERTREIEALTAEVRSSADGAALGADLTWRLLASIGTIAAVLRSAHPDRMQTSAEAIDPAAGSQSQESVRQMASAIEQAIMQLGELGQMTHAEARKRAA